MSDDDVNRNPFEETLRAIAQDIGRAVEQVTQGDLSEIAGAVGVDPARARQWVDGAGQWLRAQVEGVRETPFDDAAASRRAGSPAHEDPLRGAGPDPLDLPTTEQGVALAALESGRWAIEPGTRALAAHGDGPAPSDALGLVRELRVRDWIDTEGGVTLVGRHALGCWLDAAHRG